MAAGATRDTGEGASPPEVFVCPVSREVMKDPVVLVETGQVYDRASIFGWFQRGRNTCPLTGAQLASQNVAHLHTLRTATTKWLLRQGLKVGSSNATCRAVKASPTIPGMSDDPSLFLSIVLSKGVSVYDARGLLQLVRSKKFPEAYAALVVFREMVRHASEKQMRALSRLLDMGFLKSLLREDQLQVHVARFLVQFRDVLSVEELLSLLVIQDKELQVDVLSRLIEKMSKRRSHVREAVRVVSRRFSWVSRRLTE